MVGKEYQNLLKLPHTRPERAGYGCITVISEQYPPRNILNSPYLARFSFLCTDSPALLHRCSGMLNIGPRGSDKAVLLQGKSMMVNL